MSEDPGNQLLPNFCRELKRAIKQNPCSSLLSGLGVVSSGLRQAKLGVQMSTTILVEHKDRPTDGQIKRGGDRERGMSVARQLSLVVKWLRQCAIASVPVYQDSSSH